MAAAAAADSLAASIASATPRGAGRAKADEQPADAPPEAE